MINRPDKCCDPGSYECSVPLPLNGRVQDIDLCLCHIVAALNAGGITTLASCCGHGKIPATIVLDGGLKEDRIITIEPMSDWRKMQEADISSYKPIK